MADTIKKTGWDFASDLLGAASAAFTANLQNKNAVAQYKATSTAASLGLVPTGGGVSWMPVLAVTVAVVALGFAGLKVAGKI